MAHHDNETAYRPEALIGADQSGTRYLGWNVPPEELQYIPDHWLQYPEPEASLHYLLGLLYIAFAIFALIGNGLVIWIFLSAKSLRTPSNVFVVNLAICDFFMMAKTPIFIYNSFTKGFTLGHMGCQIFAFVGSLTGIGAGATNALIAYDRYNTITRPFEGRLTQTKALIFIFLIWAYTIPWGVLPLLEIWGRFVPEGFLTACSFDYLSSTFDTRLFVGSIFTFSYVLPMSLIIYYYSQIVSHVVNHEKQLREQAKKMNVESLRSNQNKNDASVEIRIAKAAITVCFLFVASWTPYAVLALIGAFGDKSLLTPGVTMFPACACKFVACLDPYVYAISHPRYRIELQKRLPWLAITETEASDSVVTSSTVATSETASEPQKKSTKTDGPLAKKKKRSNDISLEHVADVSHSSNLNDADQTADEPIDNAVSTANTAKVVEHGYQSPKKLTNVDPGSSKKKKRLSEAVTTSNTDVSQRGPDDVNQSAEQSMVSVVEQTNTTQDRSQVAKNLPDCAWNEEMKLFYNDVWVDEDFNLASVMQKMPRGRKHWEIMQQDLYPSPPRKQPICLKCGEQGHMRFKCRNPPKPPVCYMCGEQGHQEPRCPRTICLNCGERTRNFVRGCNACARDLNMVCKLCGVRGHGQRVCPDLWRRYHSTTEDNVPLRGQYHINMKTKYCCICCKQGHQAHACTAAYRIFGQALPTIHIKSYLPAYRGYQPHNERSQSEPEAGPRYNLFSDQANECELNLHDLAENPNGFYYRFVKSSGLIEKQQLRMNQEREAQFKVISHLQEQNHQQHQCHQQEQQQQPQHDQEQRIEDSRPIFHESLNEFKTQQQNAPEQFQNEKIPIDVQSAMQTEDSNYSFSVLAEEAELVEKNNAPQEPVETNLQLDHPDVSSVESGLQTESVAASSMPDFIPLSSEPSPPAHPATPADATESSDVTDGKVYLTKQHAKALLSDRGSIFVKEAAEKHSLKLSITFESVGNVLLICGTPNAQDLFHTELVHFLGQGDADTVNKALIAQNAIPRKVRKALYYVTEKLLQLTNAYGDVKALFSAYESAKPNDKKAQKLRCQLNMVLFGQFGLREGKKHLGTLRHHVLQMMNSKDTLLDPNHRNVIWEACMYIFSTYDHTEYKELVNEYEELRRTSQLHKFSWSDLQFQEFPGGLSLLCRLSKDPALYEMYANPGNGSNSRLLYDEQVPSAREDILLNTYDQTIDTDRLNSLDNATRDFQDDQTSPAIPDVPVDENQFCRHGRHGYATRQKRSQSEGRSQTSPAIPDVPVDENQFWRHGRQFYATLQKRSQTVKPGKALQTIQQIHRLMRKVDPPNKKFMSNHLKHLESMMPMYNGLLPNREMHQLFKMRAALKKHQTEVKRRAKAMRLAKSYTY
ncbi:uncharacterized protein LOC131263107 isoform X2 [Anopheles coustani]|uniref:uncharacterized protein LOC131263107 isoform X2 n=1 Tax=Anopheles coustani TaxID=139045 RepID=UPI00265976A7|nr:uncharacterized protein LOC131263107 isoform X2 [Anopheles coustani]